MATLLLTAEAFTRAWALAKELDETAAQARLHELWHQLLALPDDHQPHILEEVAALTHELCFREAADPRSCFHTKIGVNPVLGELSF